MSTQETKDTLSSTPRTDAAIIVVADQYGGNRQLVVSAEFAGQLERELNEAKSLNATLERSNHRLRAKFDRSYP